MPAISIEKESWHIMTRGPAEPRSGGRGRETETERRDRDGDRDKDRDRNRDGERQRDRETETERQRDRETETDTETDRETETETDTETARYPGKTSPPSKQDPTLRPVGQSIHPSVHPAIHPTSQLRYGPAKDPFRFRWSLQFQTASYIIQIPLPLPSGYPIR